jgi:quercetin dioxygenase-like cupin family protein
MSIKLLGLIAVGALAIAAPSFGGEQPIIAKPVAVGMMKATTIHAQSGAVVLDSIRVAPGGSFGWHTHGAPVAVVVTGGTLTVFDPAVSSCKPFKVSKGQSFVEPANHVHLARNDGKKPATLYAMYLGLPTTGKANIGAPAPNGCNA